MHAEAPAVGYRLGHCSIDPSVGLLKLGGYIHNASVSDQNVAYRILELIAIAVFQRATPL